VPVRFHLGGGKGICTEGGRKDRREVDDSSNGRRLEQPSDVIGPSNVAQFNLLLGIRMDVHRQDLMPACAQQ